jgi:hypothetical protein
MKNVATLVWLGLGMLSGIALATANDDETKGVDLSYHLAVGATEHFRIETTFVDRSSSFKLTRHHVDYVDVKTLELSKDGAAKVELTFTRVAMEIELAENERSPLQVFGDRVLGTLEGRQLQLTLDTKGRITAVEGVADAVTALAETIAEEREPSEDERAEVTAKLVARIGALWSDAAVRDLYQPLFLVRPDNPPTPGSEWSVARQTPYGVPTVTVHQDLRYKLDGVTPGSVNISFRADDTAKFVVVELPEDASAQRRSHHDQTAAQTLLSASFTGLSVISRTDGLPISRSLTRTIKAHAGKTPELKFNSRHTRSTWSILRVAPNETLDAPPDDR